MLRKTKEWDVRCPPALARMFPVRSGYYYKIDRAQARRICRVLAKAYGIEPPTVSAEPPGKGFNGLCWLLPGGKARIDVHGRGHIKTTFHEFYHALDHATHGKYNSDDRHGGDTSLAWQFADRLFEIFRKTR